MTTQCATQRGCECPLDGGCGQERLPGCITRDKGGEQAGEWHQAGAASAEKHEVCPGTGLQGGRQMSCSGSTRAAHTPPLCLRSPGGGGAFYVATLMVWLFTLLLYNMRPPEQLFILNHICYNIFCDFGLLSDREKENLRHFK